MMARESGAGARRLRRLPILIVIEASHRLGGALEVTIQQGLETVAQTLGDDPITSHMVHMAAIVFNETIVASQRLASVARYSAPLWEAQGEAVLGPALEQLITLMKFSLISGNATILGDLPPLIFLVLGSEPTDDWEPQLERLRAQVVAHHANVYALITNARQAGLARKITPNMISLEGSAGSVSTPASIAVGATAFFDWVIRVARMIVESQRYETVPLALPKLPPGLITVA